MPTWNSSSMVGMAAMYIGVPKVLIIESEDVNQRKRQ
jgi:hypothetical protein